jgi:hypothetical protein
MKFEFPDFLSMYLSDEERASNTVSSPFTIIQQKRKTLDVKISISGKDYSVFYDKFKQVERQVDAILHKHNIIAIKYTGKSLSVACQTYWGGSLTFAEDYSYYELSSPLGCDENLWTGNKIYLYILCHVDSVISPMLNIVITHEKFETNDKVTNLVSRDIRGSVNTLTSANSFIEVENSQTHEIDIEFVISKCAWYFKKRDDIESTSRKEAKKDWLKLSVLYNKLNIFFVSNGYVAATAETEVDLNNIVKFADVYSFMWIYKDEEKTLVPFVRFYLGKRLHRDPLVIGYYNKTCQWEDRNIAIPGVNIHKLESLDQILNDMISLINVLKKFC